MNLHFQDVNTIRYTNQRVAILEFLDHDRSHPSVEEVYGAVRQKLPRISKATVYRNLRFLAEEGLIRSVEVKGVARFEMKIKLHHHVICRRCGMMIDFESQELMDHAFRAIKNLKGFWVDSTSTNFHGTCENCREGVDDHPPLIPELADQNDTNYD